MISKLISYYTSKKAVDVARKNIEKDLSENKNILRPPFMVFIAGLILAFMFLVIMVAFTLSYSFEENLIGFIVGESICAFFLLLGIIMVLMYVNIYLIYKDGKIIHRNIFRVKRIYDCSEIVEARDTHIGGIVFIFANGKKLKFDPEEILFALNIMENEKIRKKVAGEGMDVIKVSLSLPWIIFILIVSILIPVFELSNNTYLFGTITFLIMVWSQVESCTYDKKTKLLTKRTLGIFKKSSRYALL